MNLAIAGHKMFSTRRTNFCPITGLYLVLLVGKEEPAIALPDQPRSQDKHAFQRVGKVDSVDL